MPSAHRFDFTSELFPTLQTPESYAPSQAVKDIVTDLPLGFAGSTLAAPQCPLADLIGSELWSEGSI